MNAVRQGNKFPRREVKQTTRLSDATDAGVGDHGLQNRKTRRSQKWTFSQIYTCRQKSRRNVPANQPPNSNPLLQIQVPTSTQCIPVCHLVLMYNSVTTARMLHRVLCLTTGIYHTLCAHQFPSCHFAFLREVGMGPHARGTHDLAERSPSGTIISIILIVPH